LVILSGLKISTRLQVLDTEKNVILGLYAAGNVSGDFFGDVYPTTVLELPHSRAWTFSHLAGLNATAEKADETTGIVCRSSSINNTVK
jgi:fumarate reductase flavoprotein subunit